TQTAAQRLGFAQRLFDLRGLAGAEHVIEVAVELFARDVRRHGNGSGTADVILFQHAEAARSTAAPNLDAQRIGGHSAGYSGSAPGGGAVFGDFPLKPRRSAAVS